MWICAIIDMKSKVIGKIRIEISKGTLEIKEMLL